ncbi:hypothetical protein J6590_071830 [Homalodisca vitripennis]|nr:hypothetical protein J6590_071830 [Homalodisca vitripennis]
MVVAELSDGLCEARNTPKLDPALKRACADGFFSTYQPPYYEEIEAVDISPFTLEELHTAGEKLRRKKSPGPDGIPVGAV